MVSEVEALLLLKHLYQQEQHFQLAHFWAVWP